MKNQHSQKRKKRFFVGLITGTIAIAAIAFVFSFDWANNSPFQEKGISTTNSTDMINLLYLSNDEQSQIEKAIQLDSQFNISKNLQVNSSILDNIDVVLIANYDLNMNEVGNLTDFFNNGGNIFIVFGPADGNLETLLFNLGIEGTIEEVDGESSYGIDYQLGSTHPLSKNIQWSSCPSVRNHSMIYNINVQFQVYIRLNNEQNSLGLASYTNNSVGNLMLFSPWVVHNGNNRQLEVWPYFNYMIYASVRFTADSSSIIPSYSAWPHSPVPHLQDTIIIAITVVCLGSASVIIFTYQRKKSRKSQIVLSEKAIEEITKKEDKKPLREDLSDDWEQIGTHRQISGFLFGLFAGIILGIPQIVLTGIVFPKWIMPFPQVAGWFDWVKQFFQAIWMIFDVGTSIALAKFFAQYRIKQPKKAIHYIQIFVWWQLLSGVAQISIISLLGSIIFPQTNLAHLSWIVVLHSLIQYPGFFVVFMYIFQGMQRTDLQNLANLLYQAVLMLLSQYLWIIIFRAAFANSPQGEAFWSGIGYAVGQYFAEWGIFFIMMKFYKNLGFSVSTIFRVDFNRNELKEALVFGGKEAIGHVWVPLAYMYQVWLISAFIPNWNEEMGVFGYANMLMQVTALVGFLTEGFLAPVSEAHAHKKQKLLNFTLAQGIKWSSAIIMFMIALLGALGANFILIIGSQWQGAIRFIPLLLIYSFPQPYAWLGDKSLAASGHTGLAAIIWIIEQGGKMLLLSLFIYLGILDVAIILYAHIPVLILKVIVSWLMIRKKVGSPKGYVWSSWIAPGFSSIIIYFILYSLTFIFTGWLILVEFILGVFVFLYLYFFLLGFFGAFDANTIDEFKKASRMVGKPLSGLAKPLYSITELGCKLSPGFHNRFPIDIFQDAMVEAKELEKEKLKLEI